MISSRERFDSSWCRAISGGPVILRHHAVALVAAVTTAVAAVTAVTATASDAATAPAVPVVQVHVNNHRVLVGANDSVHAGRTIFHVVTGQGAHNINIVRFRNGYTPRRFGADIGQAFGGNTHAIKRVDRNCVFRGGTDSRPHHPGAFSATLPAGTFYFFDGDTGKFAAVHVVGKVRPRRSLPLTSRIAMYSYGFDPNMSSIPHQGWTQLSNDADQPHFLALQRVKQGTTNAQVRHYFRNHAQGHPSFLLRTNLDSGIVTQGQNSGLYLNLPRGEYLLACFWPDFRTGMPHAFMGMWKLVQLT